MKVLTEKEFEGIPHGEWLECADALPPVGWEVVVKTVDGKITALTRFIRYEDAPAEHGYWDNNYPGKGNLYLFKSVVSWCKLPSPDSPFSAQLATITAQRDDLRANLEKATRALKSAGYTIINGAQEWKPPLGVPASPLLDQIDSLRAESDALKAELIDLAPEEYKDLENPLKAIRYYISEIELVDSELKKQYALDRVGIKHLGGVVSELKAQIEAARNQEPYCWVWSQANGNPGVGMFSSEQVAKDAWDIISPNGKAIPLYASPVPAQQNVISGDIPDITEEELQRLTNLCQLTLVPVPAQQPAEAISWEKEAKSAFWHGWMLASGEKCDGHVEFLNYIEKRRSELVAGGA